MKQTLNDDAQVQALAERLGAWPAIEASIAAGNSGSLLAGDWVFGFFADGLCAWEASNPMEAVIIAGVIAAKLGGAVSAQLATPAPSTAH